MELFFPLFLGRKGDSRVGCSAVLSLKTPSCSLVRASKAGRPESKYPRQNTPMISSPFPHRARPPVPSGHSHPCSRLTAAVTPPGAGLGGAARASPNQRARLRRPNALAPRGPRPPMAGSARGAAIGCAGGSAKVREARATPLRTRRWPRGGRVGRATVSAARQGSERCPPGRWGALRRRRGADPEFWRSIRLSAGAPAAPGTLGKDRAHLPPSCLDKKALTGFQPLPRRRAARRNVAGEQREPSRRGPRSHRVGVASGAPRRGAEGGRQAGTASARAALQAKYRLARLAAALL